VRHGQSLLKEDIATLRRRAKFAMQRRHREIATAARRQFDSLKDELRFSAEWVARPRTVGAIAPSGRILARAMAREVDPAVPGPVVELGPGTGVITRALIARGVAEDRLILVEANRGFAALLKERFPLATVVADDAFALSRILRAVGRLPVAAVVSGLPLFNQPMFRRLRLIAQALSFLDPAGCFVQFSYHLMPPVPGRYGGFTVRGTPRVWRNLFPARVWVYRPCA
jgi:phosphatidylethanolamine/phosphatidyl-N-methylethanolamine N-methyltransferase